MAAVAAVFWIPTHLPHECPETMNISPQSNAVVFNVFILKTQIICSVFKQFIPSSVCFPRPLYIRLLITITLFVITEGTAVCLPWPWVCWEQGLSQCLIYACHRVYLLTLNWLIVIYMPCVLQCCGVRWDNYCICPKGCCSDSIFYPCLGGFFQDSNFSLISSSSPSSSFSSFFLTQVNSEMHKN